MTKTLTEQWKDGELDNGYYWCRILDNEKDVFMLHLVAGHFELSTIKEVLSAVPSYDEFKRLVSNSDESPTEQVLNLQKMVEDECSRRCKLEEQLRIATKALKRIFYERDDRAIGDYLWIANNALKEMEGVK